MYYIGIDVGGTNLKAGLVDESYRIVATKKMPLEFKSMEQMGETLAQMALALVSESGISREEVACVGMGFPGPVDNKAGVVIKTVNIPIRFMPVAEIFHRYWDVPVYLGNDADCAALGEYYHYENKDIESLILVTLGTGIGTGIILNGKIHSGINGCAGEGGHIVIVADGEPCTCGRRGCLEAYASVTALINQTKAAMEAHPESMMNEYAARNGKVNGRTSFECARAGDPAAIAVRDRYIEFVAEGICSIVNILQPEILSIGGGISREGETLLAPIKAYFAHNDYNKHMKKTDIRIAKLFGDAGIVGAAKTAEAGMAE